MGRAFRKVGLGLYMRDGVYYARVKLRGKENWKCLHTVRRPVANAKLEEFRQELGAMGEAREEPPLFAAAIPMAVAEWQGSVKSASYLASLKHHLDTAAKSFLGTLKVTAIRVTHLESYLSHRRAETSGRTANWDASALRKFFKFAQARGWRADMPELPRYPHTEKTPYIPSWSEIGAILKWLRSSNDLRHNRCADFTEFLALTGCRMGEAQGLKWADVHWQRKVIEVVGKGNKRRAIDFFAGLEALLTQIKSGHARDREMVFPPLKDLRFDPRWSLFAAQTALDLPRFSWHALRHRWATERVLEGHSFGLIAAWLGHADGGVLVGKRYGVHIRREQFEAAASKVRPLGDADSPIDPIPLPPPQACRRSASS